VRIIRGERWRLLPGLLLIATCSNIHDSVREDAGAVGAEVQRRTGVEASSPPELVEDGDVLRDIHPLVQGELTEENAVKVSLLNNRAVRASYESLGIARADLLQAGLLSNPVFSANAKFFGSGTEVELGLAQSFLDLFRIPLRRGVAEARLREATATVTRDLIHLTFEVRRTFLQVRAANQMVEMRRHVFETTKASFDLMRHLHEAGNVTDQQLTTEEGALTRAQIELAASESFATESREPLNVLLGLWGASSAGWIITGRLPEALGSDLPLDHLEARAIASSLDLATSRFHAESLAQVAGLDTWEQVFASDSVGAVAKRESADGSWGVGPSFSLSLPLFDHGQAARAAGSFALAQALDVYAHTAVQIRASARSLRERFISLTERVRFIRDVHLPLRARLVRETLQNYNAMQIGAFDVLVARQQEIEAGREYIETLRDAWLTRLDVEELLAGSFNAERAMAPPGMAAKSSTAPMKKGH